MPTEVIHNRREPRPSFHLSIRADGEAHEAELVAAAQAGSNAAFEELQNLYTRRLYRRIFSITRNREDAEDALQDTFLRAYIKLKTFERRSGFNTWLTRIAINSALMTLRKRRTRGEMPLGQSSESGGDAALLDVRDPTLDPEQICDQRQRCLGMIRAIQKLDPKLRSAIQVWTTQDCSMKDVARTLDVSLGSVKARLHRARRRLRRSAAFGGRGTIRSIGRRPESIPCDLYSHYDPSIDFLDAIQYP